MNPIETFMHGQIGKGSDNNPSPVGKWLGGDFITVEAGKLVCDYVIRPEMTNPLGNLHGGTVSLIMDELIGAAVFSLNNEKMYTSVNLSVNFLRPARQGDTIRATAEVVRKGRKIMYIECKIENEAGKLVAHGTSNMVAVGPSPMYQKS